MRVSPLHGSHIKVLLLGWSLLCLDMANSSSDVHFPSCILQLPLLPPPHFTIFTLLSPCLQCCLRNTILHSCVCGRAEGERASQPCPMALSVSLVPEVLGNTTSLRVQEGQSLRLVCDTDGNYPARLSWSRGSLTLIPTQPLDPGVLELPRVVLGDGGEFTCRAQHPWGSYHSSVTLVVQGISCSCPHISGEQRGTWPLVLTLLRGVLMGAGFLLTYGLTWIYYTRFRGSQGDSASRRD
nr:sialic acid-binding Ig-like lectin 14 isoform X1 [Equus caballus]